MTMSPLILQSTEAKQKLRQRNQQAGKIHCCECVENECVGAAGVGESRDNGEGR